MHWKAHQSTTSYMYPDNPQMPKFVSIITGNYNHTGFVAQLIHRLYYMQDRLPENFEIIVSDTGSSLRHQEAMFGLLEATQGKVKIKYVMHDMNYLRKDTPHFHGWSFCINAALRVADGDIIVYCDSSILIPENFIYLLAAPHVNQDKLFVRCTTYNFSEKETAQSLRENWYRLPWKDLFERLSKKKTSLGRSGWSVQRKELLAIRGADERFTHYGCHDDDMIMRLMMNGCKNMMGATSAIHQHHKEDRDSSDKYNETILKKNVFQRRIVTNNVTFGRYDWVKMNWRENEEDS